MNIIKVWIPAFLICFFIVSHTLAKDLKWKIIWEKSSLNDSLGGNKIYPVIDRALHRIYCVSNTNYIEALNSETGALVWLSQFKGSENEGFGIPFYFMSRLYWGNINGNYYGYNTKNQSPVFSIITNPHDSLRRICRDPFSGAINDSILVIGGQGKGYSSIIQALDWNSGAQKWRIDIKGSEIRGKPAFDNKRIYFIAGEQIIATTFQGAIAWTFSGDYSGFDNNYPVISNRALFYVSAKTIYALDIESGLCIWKKENVTKKISVPLLYNGKVYLGGGSGVVFCLDANSGKEIWKSTLPSGVIIQNQPAVYNNTLLIVHNIIHESSDFHLFFLDPKSGWIP